MTREAWKGIDVILGIAICAYLVIFGGMEFDRYIGFVGLIYLLK